MHSTKSSGIARFGIIAVVALLIAGQSPFSAYAADTNTSAKANFVETKSASTVDVTVYGNSFAQVEETRQVTLSAGRNRIQLNGIAAQYRQDSLRLIGTDGPGEFTYKSATYQAANMTWDQILKDSVGQKITAVVGHGDTAKTVSGTLINVNSGRIILKGDDGKTYLTGTNGISLSSMPTGLSSTASLVVEAEVSVAGTYELNFLYETGGMTWSTKHSVIYDDENQKLESFETTVNVINQSGTNFDNATLWLLSGNVNEGRGMAEGMAYAASVQRRNDSAPVENVGERKVYRISEKVSLGNGQQRQIPLFKGADVPVKREFFLPANNNYNYNYRYGRTTNGLQPVNVRLQLKNCQESNLGQPLPAGTVKVYQRNSEDKLQLTGSTLVPELADNQAFTLNIGTSSDIKAERKLARSVKVNNGQLQPRNQAVDHDDTYEVTIHNFKDNKDIEVIVEATVPANQQNITPLTRESATKATATVKVLKGQTATLEYTIRVKRN